MRVILQDESEPDRFCVKLPYRGFEISLSRRFRPADLAVFGPDDDFGQPVFIGLDASAEGIRDAMIRIDNLIALAIVPPIAGRGPI